MSIFNKGLNVVNGNIGAGKTHFVTREAVLEACSKNVFIFSGEYSKEEIKRQTRCINNDIGISEEKLSIYVYSGNNKSENVLDVINKALKDNNCSVFIFDDIDPIKFNADDYNEKWNARIEFINKLKEFAITNDVTVVLTTRSCEQWRLKANNIAVKVIDIAKSR